MQAGQQFVSFKKKKTGRGVVNTVVKRELPPQTYQEDYKRRRLEEQNVTQDEGPSSLDVDCKNSPGTQRQKKLRGMVSIPFFPVHPV